MNKGIHYNLVEYEEAPRQQCHKTKLLLQNQTSIALRHPIVQNINVVTVKFIFTMGNAEKR